MLATTTEPALPETADDKEASRRGRLVAWGVALIAPAVVGLIWCGLVPTWWGSLSALVLILVLATSAVTDTWQRLIPNWATYTAVIWGLAINIYASIAGDGSPPFLGAVGIVDAGAGLAMALLVAMPAVYAGIAPGDVKLAAAIATLIGWKLGLLAICTSVILAGTAAACWSIWLIGPFAVGEWFVRTVGTLVLPTLIAPPSGELQLALSEKMPLGLFFAIGTPLAIALGAAS